MKHNKAILFFLLGAALVAGCSKDNGGSGGGTNPPGNPGSGTPGARFTAVRSIVQSNCATAGCHSGNNAQSGINFGSDATIVAQKDRIKVRAVDQAGTASQMPPPPAPALSAANRTAITDWINAGGRLTD